MPFASSSKNRLTRRDLPRFSGDGLFDRLGRALCEIECLPRKELFEAWELAKRVRRRFRGGRVVDVAGGHGLLAHALLLLDDTSPEAHVIDPAVPKSANRLSVQLAASWERLTGRVRYQGVGLGEFPLEVGDLVVSSHACGSLTDEVFRRAIAARARVAVMPCCHDARTCDVGVWKGWLDVATAIDVQRVCRLEREGYRVWTSSIPSAVTPKNRVILGAPLD